MNGMMKSSKRRMRRSNHVITAGFDASPRRIRWLRIATVLLVIGLLVSGCGGGGNGTGTMPSPDPGTMPSPDPGTIPSPDPGTIPDPCIQTADFGCISAERYNEESYRIAQSHRTQTDFSNQWGLAAINANQAYANLNLAKGSNVEPGAGVTVGLIDTGIDQDHPVFEGTTMEEIYVLSAVDERGGKFSHGTAVASVVSARPGVDPAGFHGVAWGADLKMFATRFGDPQPGTPYSPVSPDGLKPYDEYSVKIFNVALEQAVDILNLSFALQGIIENYTEQVLRANFGRAISVLAQTEVQDKTILVWAAGNNHQHICTPGSINCVGSDQEDSMGNPAGLLDASSVQLYAGLPVRIEELRGHSIAVVAVNEDGDITEFSNRCGIAAEWCLAAPGEDMLVAYFGPNNGIPGVRGFAHGNSGTSYAAPMVSGGLAVMKQLFRDQLSNVDLVTRLFATADKSGKFADKNIYGQGMMDLGAATSPVGEATVAVAGNRVSGAGVSIRSTSLRLGRAFGDGLSRSLAGQEIVAFDSLGAPFWFTLNNFAGSARGPSSFLRLHELMEQTPITQRFGDRVTTFIPGRVGGAVEQEMGYGRLRFGLRETPAGVEGGHFVLVQDATTLTLTGHNGMAATAFTTSGFAGMPQASGAALSWRPFDVPVGFRAGWIAEQQTLLGTTAAGAFGRLSANAVFTGLETGFDVGKWRLAADAEMGTATPRLQGGMIARVSSLTTSAFALNATRRLANGGSVRISLSQPLRVEDGLAALSVPVGRTKHGVVVRQPVSAGLVPSGREIDISARWHHLLADGSELRFDAAWIRQPGHNVQAKPAVRLLAGWRFEF